MPSEDSKPVKKGEVEAEAGEGSLSSMIKSRKKKPTNNAASLTTSMKKEEVKDEADEKILNSIMKPRMKKPTNNAASLTSTVKKEEAEAEEKKKNLSPTQKPRKKTEKELKKKKKGEEKKSAVAEQNAKRVKKVYDLPGQKRDPPEERDPLRIFYETLYKQVPNSEMAQFWMMESGLLPKEMAQKLFEQKQKNNQQQKLASPTKKVGSSKKNRPSSPISSNQKKTADSKVGTKQSKKRKNVEKNSEDESDEDFIVSGITKKQKTK